MTGIALFETAVGRCGIAWGDAGILAASLPERSDDALRRRLRRRAASAVETTPPSDVQAAIDGIVALLRGEPRDLFEVRLDMVGVPSFQARVYEVTRAIPPGRTMTYGAVAAGLGEPGAAQAVGQALGANPFPPIVPCHRVLAADGSMHGFSAHGGVDTKRRMLLIEGAGAVAQQDLFDRI